VVLLTVAALFAASCSRSGSGTPSTNSAPASGKSSSSATATAAGQFGSVKQVCAPGTPSGGSGRGITSSTIRLGVLADPGSTAAPGLGQEFFDVATAFMKWCNDAGGINGRKIVVDKLDAKLFNVASSIISACQHDFMLVGGGNPLDAPGVAPRLGCKLGQVPGYTASPEATAAGLQVNPTASTPLHYPVGVLKLLSDAYPVSQQGFGIAGSALASLTPQGLRAQEAWQRLGYKVSTVQPRPALVDNYRSWMEQFKAAGAKASFEITATNTQPIFSAINDTGFKPAFVLFGQGVYNDEAVKAAKSVSSIPPTYINLQNLPWDLSGQFPVIQQAKSIMQAAESNPQFDAFTSLAFNAWVLWAQAATACGNNLSQDCVLQNAGNHPHWDGGGMFGPVNTDPKLRDYTDCTLIVKLTTSGWKYDKDITKPNNGVFNCSPDNLMTVKAY
jgi:ABC-type branched-subunit amino acid transport system substrate-binding protein